VTVATLPTNRSSIRERLSGQHLLVTGSTGFLAKAFVEKVLRSVPTIGGLTLLIRPREGGSSAERRLQREVLGSSAFDRLRASLGARFDRLCAEKLRVVAGDLTLPHIGIADEEYAELTRRITAVVNSAATVTFDEQLDMAIELNALGPSRLLAFAKDCGNVPMLHVSTCYVSGVRSGVVVEDFSAPERARESLPRVHGGGEVDLDGLIDAMREDVEEVRRDCGGDEETLRRELIALGMEWSRRFGWSDTYTFTKWIGEQYLLRQHGDVPVNVFRPAIIESGYDEPAPGWIDGLRMADPIIVAYGKGRLDEFPALGEVPIDLIPVDWVVNGMLATLPVGEGGTRPPRVFQCCSSDRNPLLLGDFVALLQEAFLLRPMIDDEGRPIVVGPLRPVPQDRFLRRWQRRQRNLARVRRWLGSGRANNRRSRRLAARQRQIDQLLYFAQIYSPYTHLNCSFASDGLEAVSRELSEEDSAEFPVDVARIDWRDYVINRHVPGLRSFVLGTGFEPSPRIRGAASPPSPYGPGREALEGENLFEVFQRSASRFADKPALQVRRANRWLRYSYREVLEATGSIMKRLTERGLCPGDRVAICGENGPEWGLTYLAVMRAGMTAVPLDPQLAPTEAWQMARYAGVKLMGAGATTMAGLEAQRRTDDAEIVRLDAPFVPPPGASRDPAPDPVDVRGRAVASILFTSGTTVAPKAVQLSHANFIANASALLQVHPIYPTDEFLSVLPLYHAFEFTGGFLLPLVCGATITYVEQLKGPQIVSAMKSTGTTAMLVVPRLLQLFHNAIRDRVAESGVPRRAGFRALQLLSALTGHRFARTLFRSVHDAFGGRLRIMVSGASRLEPEIMRSFRRLGFVVSEGYGMTETSPVLTVNPPERIRLGSVGRPLPNVELEIRDANREGVGEIWARGPSVMTGYLDNPEATRDILVDGWLRTGDLGRVDAEGYLYITGRTKDLIITSAGKNVYPDEVEHAYQELPYVREMCVLAMPSADGLGDAVHAVVVADYDAPVDLDRSSIEREIRAAAASIAERLPSHQRISSLHFWDRPLPRTTTLKAKRQVIREMLPAAGVGRPRQAGESDAGTADASHAPSDDARAETTRWARGTVLDVLARQCGRPAESIHEGLNLVLDLGIDSIGKMDVLGQVEAAFDMRIDNERAASVSTVADLLRIVSGRRPKRSVPRDSSPWRRRLETSDAAPSTNGTLSPVLLPVRWMMRGVAGAFMNSYVRVRAIGRRNIPARGAFILAPNHSSHLDSPSVVSAVGGRRRVWAAGAEDYFFTNGLKRFVFGRVFDTIAFDRQADGLRGLRRCGEVLARGDGLLLFPEGTRSVNGEMQPFKIGVSVLAIERGVPVVPVYIDRTHELLPKGGRFVRPGTVTVVFGEPIAPPELNDDTDRYQAYRELTRQLHDAVSSLAATVAK
jgi:long-chain acyl-CoA synthetase